MRKTKLWLAPFVAALICFAAAPALHAQATAKISGHCNDPLGQPMANVQVTLSTNGGATAKYTFVTDSNGDYTGSGVKPGLYTLSLFNTQKKIVDQQQNVVIPAGGNIQRNFDLSRAAYIAKMSPAERKEFEAVKAKNAVIEKENAKIKNLNADLEEARKDNAAKNYAAADALMTRDTTIKPDAAVLWVELGRAQKGENKLDAAVTSFNKAISDEQAQKKPKLDVVAAADNELGEVLATQNKLTASQAAYDEAAKDDPKNAEMYYGNEAIMMDRAGDVDATVAAADKAIAANPKNPIPYYLKGKALINKATVDPKTQKIIAPPGCAEAYQKYLELAPNGQFAADAKAILAQLGTKVQSSYRR